MAASCLVVILFFRGVFTFLLLHVILCIAM
jgi:hypothetical protein